MNNLASLLLSACAAAAFAAVSVYFVLRPDPDARGGPLSADLQVAEQLEAVASRLDRLEQQLEARAAPAPVRTPTDAPSRADVEQWIAEALAERGSAQPSEAAGDEFRIDSAVAQLVEVGVTGDAESQAIWDRARQAGKVKELIAAFERRAQEEPNSADAQSDLGDAYVQGIFGSNDMMAQSLYGQKADRAYDAALKLDETHWRARFSKATGLTFWPDFLGKKAEAIQHFEILATQQESTTRRPEYQQTWVVLGNLYQQQGKDDEARRAWERGLTQFPNDPQLLEKLGR